MPHLPPSAFTNWLAFGERGISSEAIVSHLTGANISQYPTSSDYPHDPGDFGRCQRLLKAVPLARLLLPEMASRSPQWERLVDAWDEIAEAIEDDGFNGYMLMRRVIAGGTECTACNGTGAAEPCPKCKGTGRRSGGRCRATGCYRGHAICANCRGRGYTGGDR